MARPAGNTRLKSARMAAGYHSQQALADALKVGVRQVRRWESDTPPWPQPDVAQALTRLLGQDLESLGFAASDGPRSDRVRRAVLADTAVGAGLPTVPTQAVPVQPASVAQDFAAVTRSHRRLYWSVAPATLHPAALSHAALGCALLLETAGQTRERTAAALAETWLLAARIEFFDLRDADRAQQTLVRALQAAGEANASLLGATILAHSAFIPAWAGEREAALERMTAARTYARRGPACANLLAWLDAVEAECETRCGSTRKALQLIQHAEDVLAAGSDYPSPEWLDWFNPVRLAAFKGNTQLKAGHLPQARETLQNAFDALSPSDDKQRTVVLGDLAAVEAAAGNPGEACRQALRALDGLERAWYAMGMDRVREVRRALVPHQHEPCVRELDDRLYDWSTAISALSR
ncbi:helix-turn-helix domain-containing protein [Streptomyces sp. MI02-2A]|uniref:helix-turn-helix domain-containing protein n=1 Tax=Streptomyces sp. MI02-2A TaxID=3028688 RepID=UPI0029A15B21|nr:helix-turn-helix domain-containing protein [Streptomyces sp. MI02-2A]MDX3265593.1 helix-turn-helix domain-containing protein [Streptomyces sp. MI02-2A]